MKNDLKELLYEYGQEHLLQHMALMTDPERAALSLEISRTTLEQADDMYGQYAPGNPGEKASRVLEAAEALSFSRDEPSSRQVRKRLFSLGEDCLRQGRVAAFLVAGGQGTRLGFQGPKGCYPISPVKGKSLFQLFAERLRALGARYGRPLHWYIMTSQENHEQSLAFFESSRFFGLDRQHVHFFKQSRIPSLDLEGRLILSQDKTLFKNPNGHGGSLYALQESGALEEMAGQGVEEIFYFQVDNPLAKIADPLFIGAHVEGRAEISTKVVKKTDPAEKVGIIGRIDGKLGCIEYSELSLEEAAERNSSGDLRFGSANIAIHMLSRGFVEKLNSRSDFHLPYHIAEKEIECLGISGVRHVPDKIKGLKFEMFIFDALGFAERSVTLEVAREEEFSPVKNSRGADSPETARRAMIDLHTRWLQQAGGDSRPDDLCIEVSPLFAIDEEEFTEKFTPPSPIISPFYVE